jgi:pilus assembly protein CpaF
LLRACSVPTLQDLFVYEVEGEDDRGKVRGVHRSTGIARPKFWDRARYFNEHIRLAKALADAETGGSRGMKEEASFV